MAQQPDRSSEDPNPTGGASTEESGGVCLSDNDVLDFVGGGMGETAREAVRNHLASCSSCRQLVSEAVRALEPRASGVDSEPPTDAPSFPFAPRPPNVGDVVDDKYRIERVVGHGGMGVVFAATHLVLQHPVAIKFLWSPTAISETGKQRFLREGRAAVRIDSEHVTRVMDVGVTAQGVPYVVMELLEGRDLRTELEANGPMPWRVVVDWMLQALDAIATAHDAHIVHRDLKPANLFVLDTAPGARRIKVLDFGVSKLNAEDAKESITTTASMLGSPAYMAPEQMEDSSRVDARADVWSVGVTLFEMLTGTLPHAGATVASLYRSIREASAPSVRSRKPEVPESVDRVVRRCLAPDPQDRYADGRALREALLAALRFEAEHDGEVRVVKTNAPRWHLALAVFLIVVASLAGVVTWMRARQDRVPVQGLSPLRSVVATPVSVPAPSPQIPANRPEGGLDASIEAGEPAASTSAVVRRQPATRQDTAKESRPPAPTTSAKTGTSAPDRNAPGLLDRE